MTNRSSNAREPSPRPDEYLVAFFAEQYDNSTATPAPTDREGWRQEAKSLIAVQDAYMRQFPNGEELKVRPDYNYLLGRLSIVLRELTAYGLADVLKDLDDL